MSEIWPNDLTACEREMAWKASERSSAKLLTRALHSIHACARGRWIHCEAQVPSSSLWALEGESDDHDKDPVTGKTRKSSPRMMTMYSRHYFRDRKNPTPYYSTYTTGRLIKVYYRFVCF